MIFTQHALTDGDALVGDDTTDTTTSDRVVGLLLITAFTATFWMLALFVAGHLLGSPFAPLTLALTGAAIAAFLAIICSAIRRREPA